MPIKNIIFDLGGVIVNINYHLTVNSFKKLGALNFDEIYSQLKQTSVFDDFETGKICADKFRAILKSKFDLCVSDKEFDDAWNAMLLDIPLERLAFIKTLRKDYKVFLFSNTNSIHLAKLANICNTIQKDSFDNYFDAAYYSHLYGKRKPSVDGFLGILAEQNILAEETIFIDDTYGHILGAQGAGLHTFFITKDNSIFDILNELKKMLQLYEFKVFIACFNHRALIIIV